MSSTAHPLPPCPVWILTAGSAPSLVPWHPQLCLLPSLVLLCTLGAAPEQDLGGQDLGALPYPLLPPPRVRAAVSTLGSELTSCGSHPGGV